MRDVVNSLHAWSLVRLIIWKRVGNWASLDYWCYYGGGGRV